jgi:hypothetical protein
MRPDVVEVFAFLSDLSFCLGVDVMDLDDFVQSEVIVAVVATGALLSSRGRKVARRGLVYGLAGALRAGDMLTSFGKGVAGGMQGATQRVQENMPGRSEEAEPAGE